MIILLIFVLLALFFLFICFVAPDEEEEEEQRKKRLNSNISGHKRRLKEITKFFWELHKNNVILIMDSNIWMNQEYNDLFLLLENSYQRHNRKILISGYQFDEIVNIKNRKYYYENENKVSEMEVLMGVEREENHVDSKENYRDSEKNKNARVALKRMQIFQEKSILEVEDLTKEARKGIHTDPLLIDLVIRKLEKGHNVYYISNDKEHMFRMKAFTNKFDRIKCIFGDEFQDKAIKYFKSISYLKQYK